MTSTWAALARRNATVMLWLLVAGLSHGYQAPPDLPADEPPPKEEKTSSGTAEQPPVPGTIFEHETTDPDSNADPYFEHHLPGLLPTERFRKEYVDPIWGILDFRVFPVGQRIASNGVEFDPLFLLDLNFNVMLWRKKRIYQFANLDFWGQKAAPGITNSKQGNFDFSKREFDCNLGLAWNFHSSWEARAFAYSFNNLNRGTSKVSPNGFNDGVALEGRYYLDPTYADLGSAAFDQARATFLSMGYYPSKSMVDGTGYQFKPGPFARAYLTCDLIDERCYLFGNFVLTGTRDFEAQLFEIDAGVAARPFTSAPRLELRTGTLDTVTLQGGDVKPSFYLAIRYVY
ncbi:MAG: hypothetical protein DWH82_11920 [Planctomycetota bacterium]|nr:MAG: hypothetical protein DWH82_11920 [Planctomycetota bacterium]